MVPTVIANPNTMAGVAEIQALNDLDGTAIAAGQTLLLPEE